MNQREKILAAAIVALLLVLGLGYAVTRLSSTFSTRRAEVTRLQRDLADRQRRMSAANRAEKRLRVYRQISLPSNSQLAASRYREWLNQTVNEVGASQIGITAATARAAGKAYTQHMFSVKCHINLEQLTKLLFEFYSTDQLHRIKQLSLRPIPDSKDLDLTLRIEALSIAKAENESQLNAEPSDRLAHGELVKYQEKIIGRNLFSPANNAPKITSSSRQAGNPNRPLSFTVKASDADKLDQLTYALEGEKLAGARIDAKSGQVQWTPKDKGEFELTVVATDNGLPARSDRQTIKIAVADPPPPPIPPKKKLEFDQAKHTVLTGITTDKEGRVQAWLLIKPTGETLFLHEGDKIEVGSVLGTVTRIGNRGAEIETEEKRILIAVGESLLEGLSAKSGDL